VKKVTHNDAKKYIYALVSMYFGAATVIWGQTKNVFSCPLIVLTEGTVVQHYKPITAMVNAVPVDCYEQKMMVQVDLFTEGKDITGEGMEGANENTAVNDMLEFLAFVNSAKGTAWLGMNNMTVITGAVLNLTGIINETEWEYRAMTELEVTYITSMAGYSATIYDDGVPHFENGMPKYDKEGYSLDEQGNRLELLPLDEDGKPIYPEVEHTPSGGRSQDLADSTAGWFSEVEINKEENNGLE